MSNTSLSSARLPEQLHELGPEMIVASFALDWLDDDGGDVRGLLREHRADFLLGNFLLGDDVGKAFLSRATRN
jgi:hypothetical protein